MNFVFGLIPSLCASAALLLLALFFRKHVKFKPVISVCLLMIFVNSWYSFNTYGPRVEVNSYSIPYTPESVSIESGAEFSEVKDRSKVFSNEINKGL